MNRKVILGQLEVDLGGLTDFIVKAKKHCYAGNGTEKREADGSKTLTYQEGNLHYTDNYDGFFQAPGTETVRWRRETGQRIWQMSYSGGMSRGAGRNKELASKTFDFLKEALMLVTPELPFRGPREYERGVLTYKMNFEGDITRFFGREFIHSAWNGNLFSQDFIGGLVVPK